MLHWALFFCIATIIEGVFGFLSIAAGAESIAKILFFIFLMLFLASLGSELLSRKSQP